MEVTVTKSCMSRSSAMVSFFRSAAACYRWLRSTRPGTLKGRAPTSVLAAVVLTGTVFCAPSGADSSGYASLVRRVAPSVVTILVEEAPVGAGQRAAARAAASDYDSVQVIIRRLLSGPNGDHTRDDGATAALGSGFIIRTDGLIVTNRHVVVGARKVHVHLPDGRDLIAETIGSPTTSPRLLMPEASVPVVASGTSIIVMWPCQSRKPCDPLASPQPPTISPRSFMPGGGVGVGSRGRRHRVRCSRWDR
jgi:S1-C subfamily serine protease